MWLRCAVVGANCDLSAAVRLEARSREPQISRRSLAAGRVENDVGGDLLVAAEVGHRTAFGSALHRVHLFAEAERHAEATEVVLKRLHDLGVHEVEQALPLVDDRDRRAQRRCNRGVLEPDHASADDGQRARDGTEPQDPVRVDHSALIEVHTRRPQRRGADRNHEPLARDPIGRIRRPDLEGVGVQE